MNEPQIPPTPDPDPNDPNVVTPPPTGTPADPPRVTTETETERTTVEPGRYTEPREREDPEHRDAGQQALDEQKDDAEPEPEPAP